MAAIRTRLSDTVAQRRAHWLVTDPVVPVGIQLKLPHLIALIVERCSTPLRLT